MLGYSKRIAEGITAARAEDSHRSYVSVRFGNVLGSRGSVLTAFARQIAEGGPVTVTDEEVTRYFMTIEEACQLVIQAAAIGQPGEALVLDMGEPVRIVDVARQLMDQSGRRVPHHLHRAARRREDARRALRRRRAPRHPSGAPAGVPRAGARGQRRHRLDAAVERLTEVGAGRHGDPLRAPGRVTSDLDGALGARRRLIRARALLRSLTTMSAPVVVAEVVRSGFVEGHHHGSVVALSADGTPAWSVGDVTSPVLPRSCNKPLQALGMVRLGLDLPPELLALACASHSGEPFHLEGVRRILALGDLDVDALQTPPDYPLDDAAKVAAIRAGDEPSSLAMNCSGKHAAMLLTCVVNGWDTGDLPVTRPPAAAGDRGDLRRADRRAGGRHRRGRLRCAAAVHLADRAGPRLPGPGGGDRGAGAPGRRGDPRAPGVRLRHDPRRAQAAQRDPGAIGKAGAEACYAVALPDGRAYALKIDDGGARARPVVMAEALRRSGVPAEAGVDAAALDDTGRVPVLGAGEPVGEIRAAF